MYEHPIKRAGLSFNRILFSNTRMVQQCFPGSNPQRFQLSYTMRQYDNGKETKRDNFTSDDLDNVLPTTKKGTE
jgi:hypothetical protein